jgi:type IV pilus assembly protein PilB
MAHLDISERRLPQDGRFQISQTKIIDVRINTCPTLHGEKVVLRLLDVGHVSLDIDALGFTHMQKEIFIKKIFSPQGMVLVTGPTGSGKTVTLYSALKRLNNSEKNISTVEDPVEIQLAGINQVNINPRIGLNFSTTLKTFLRQDPDILMVGEIRDKETAEIAVQAAQTGHLVLSTVHTNSALETITRLQSMNIPAYQLVSAISLIISQRLVRKLCVNCKIPDTSCEVNSACREQGCQHCLQGYLGRTGIYEFLVISEILRELILADAPRLTIAEHLQREGFLSLREAGLSLVKKGITSVAEINRVIRDSA